MTKTKVIYKCLDDDKNQIFVYVFNTNHKFLIKNTESYLKDSYFKPAFILNEEYSDKPFYELVENKNIEIKYVANLKDIKRSVINENIDLFDTIVKVKKLMVKNKIVSCNYEDIEYLTYKHHPVNSDLELNKRIWKWYSEGSFGGNVNYKEMAQQENIRIDKLKWIVNTIRYNYSYLDNKCGCENFKAMQEYIIKKGVEYDEKN